MQQMIIFLEVDPQPAAFVMSASKSWERKTSMLLRAKRSRLIGETGVKMKRTAAVLRRRNHNFAAIPL